MVLVNIWVGNQFYPFAICIFGDIDRIKNTPPTQFLTNTYINLSIDFAGHTIYKLIQIKFEKYWRFVMRKELKNTILDRRFLTLVVTENCNLACKYCYEVHKNNKGKMSFEIAKKQLT